MKHLLKMGDLTPEELTHILDVADKLKADQKAGGTAPLLKGKSVALMFSKNSTRTRTSFEVGVYQLGGLGNYMNAATELQSGRGEPLKDTARVLGRYYDCVVWRTYRQRDLEEFAEYAGVPVINGLTDYAHPCQVLADLMTIRERRGPLAGQKLCFVGDGSNMANSLIVGGLLAGPALAGMYDTVLRALRDEAGYWWTTYRRAFKRNFKSAILPGIVYCTVVTIQIFLVYFCFNMLYHGTNVGLPMWVATVLNLVLLHMLFSYMWPQVVLLDQPFTLTLKNSLNCMIAFLPHALASSIVAILFWGVVILCMPLGIFLMLIFGFWFQTEVCCQIVYGDIDRVFHIEENIRKMKDAELEAALRAADGHLEWNAPEEAFGELRRAQVQVETLAWLAQRII